jgi:hypothetical protein
MTKTELKPLYTEAAARARVAPTASELAVWMSQLGHGDIRDLKVAIDAHFAKSQWMPKEGELKPLMEQARQARESAGIVPRSTYARWKCGECGVERGGYIEASDYRARHCKGIKHVDALGIRAPGPQMAEIFRQDNFKTGNRAVSDAA